MSSKPVIAVIGGIGAQGTSVIKALAEGNQYTILGLTRSASQPNVVELAKLPNVKIIEGSCYDESTLFKVFEEADYAYVNTNGPAIGQRNETYWGIRIFEIARSCGITHYQWASLPYSSKLGDYNQQFKCGHTDGKGRVAEFIKSQPTTPMKWTIHTTVPYLELLFNFFGPCRYPETPDLVSFRSALGDVKVPLIYLDDIGRYARWIFDHPERSTGINLQVSSVSTTWDDIVKAFNNVTGQKAEHKRLTIGEAVDLYPGNDMLLGQGFDPHDPTLLSVGQNFSGMLTMLASGKVLDLIDYELLDDVLPDRLRSVEDWMRKTKYTGEHKEVIMKDWSRGGK
ncbi:NmrA family protein [Trichoderma sp. SZMC 28013]